MSGNGNGNGNSSKPAGSGSKKNGSKDCNKEPAKIGRPSKYEDHPDEYNLKVWLLAAKGSRNEDIAVGLGISTATLHDYRLRYPDFLSALNKGRAVACGKLEDTLYSLAMGSEYEETKMIGVPEKDASGKIVYDKNRHPVIIAHRVERIKKKVQPDREAILACLKAWKPRDGWNPASKVAMGGDPEGVPLQVTSLTDDELIEKLMAIAAKKKQPSG